MAATITTAGLRGARNLLLLPLAFLLLLAVTSASAAQPVLHPPSATGSPRNIARRALARADSAVSPHRVERKLFSWDGVTVDQIIAGSLGTIDGPDDDEVTTKIVDLFMNAGYNVMVIQSAHSVQGDPASAQVEVWHFWDNSEFTVYYKKGPFSVENLGNGGYENWAFGGVWQRYGADEKVPMAATNARLRAPRELLVLPLAFLLLLAATSASAARPVLHASPSANGVARRALARADSAVSPHRVERRKLFSWDGVTVDQIIAGSLGTIDGPEDDEVTTKIVDLFMNAGYNVMVIQSAHSVQGDPASAAVEVWHFWDNSEFTVYYKQGPFSVENLGNGGYENWAFGGNWQRYGADEKVVVFS
ncbi:unnamed protein product [Closterium sp. Naga37s-1]|nr:unnamed protein product [Closterium sp. Naga37s-1]